MGVQWDWPNQQVVREDLSGPGSDTGPPVVVAAAAVDPLDEMTKAELIDEAARRGVDVDPYATKAEIREALGG